MAHWLVLVPRERHLAEQLYHHEALELPADPGGPAEGDDVVIAAGEPPVVFGLGRVHPPAVGDESDPDDPAAPEVADADVISVRYTHRLLDDPAPLNGAAPRGLSLGRPHRLSGSEFAALKARIGPQHSVTAEKRGWLVGVDLPIEATSPAEAVRLFWSYVKDLGPSELPTFVSPVGDELAMQAYVLGAQANLDPEEEE